MRWKVNIWWKWILLLPIVVASQDDYHGIEKRDTRSDEKRVVCYYTNWSVYRPGTAKFTPQNINPYLCTHLIYAFGGLDKDHGLKPYDKYQDIEQGGYAKFNGLKTYNKNLKTLLAIGGWNEGSSRFSKLVADEEKREIFVKNVIKFLRQNNFDGLDLDWEYPAFRDGSHEEDKENYASLVKELREEFDRESIKTGKPRLLVTMAVPAGIEYIDKGYDVPKLNRYLDFMNILSYDYHSAFEPSVNHHSPLYSLQEESEYNFDAQLSIDYTVKHYLKAGADRNKLVLGIPSYGRSYTLLNPESTDLGSPADGPGEKGDATREKGYLAYYEICGNLAKNDEWSVVYPKRSAMGPYAYLDNQWVGYDDEDIVKKKAEYVNEMKLGGIMYWSIDNDDFRGKCHGKPYPLIEAGKAALLGVDNADSSTADKKKSNIRKNRPKQQPSTTTPAFDPLSTPEPPTTPDPGSDFVCKDEGFFPHPRDCKKYFWCLDSGPSNLGIVGHQFTCPSGLVFNKLSDSCDYSRNVVCNIKKSDKTASSTTSSPKVTAATAHTTQLKHSTTTPATTTTSTTTTTEEYEEEVDIDSQEDPKAIKQLINLIKKLGGIQELEKQLTQDSSAEITTPALSRNLYDKVFNSGQSASRFHSKYRNAPSGPQNEGLTRSEDDDLPLKKEKPQYVTIQRNRPSKTIPTDAEASSASIDSKSTKLSDAEDEDEEDRDSQQSTSRYKSRTTEGKSTPKYVVLERNRPEKSTTEDEETETSSTRSSTTQRYITIVRQRHTTTSTQSELVDEVDVTTVTPTKTTELATEPARTRVSSDEEPSSTSLSTSAQTTPINELISESTGTENIPSSTRGHFLNRRIFNKNRENQSDKEYTSTLNPETTRTVTRVITSIVEAGTARTRIPLRRLEEFMIKNKKNNKYQDELRNNKVEDKVTDEGKPDNKKNYFVTEASTTAENEKYRRGSTRRYNTGPVSVTAPTRLNQRRFGYSTTTEPFTYSTTESLPRTRFSIGRRRITTKPIYVTEATTETSETSSISRRRPTTTTTTTSTTTTELQNESTTQRRFSPRRRLGSKTTESTTKSTVENTTENTIDSTEDVRVLNSFTRKGYTDIQRGPDARTEDFQFRPLPTIQYEPINILSLVTEPAIESTTTIEVPTFTLESAKNVDFISPHRFSNKDETQFVNLNESSNTSPHDFESTVYRIMKVSDTNYRAIEEPEKKYNRDLAYNRGTRKYSNNFSTEEKLLLTNNFDFQKVHPLQNDIDTYLSPTEMYLTLNEESITEQRDNDVLSGSETRYNEENSKETYDGETKQVSYSSEGPFRNRTQFRRPGHRFRSTTSTTTAPTTSTEAPRIVDENKFLRKRKLKPEHRTTTTESDNYLLNTETTTNRRTAIGLQRRIPDSLPLPAAVHPSNYTEIARFRFQNVILDDVDAQTVNALSDNYSKEDVSDLANSAVAALSHLKTLPPSSSYTSSYISETPSETVRRTRPLNPTTVSYIQVTRQIIPNRRGSYKKPKTTTIQPVEMYIDYPDSETDYRAEPVEIPISGKVRIHNDGYIECLDMGNFPHPFSCKKFISCAKMEYDSLLGWEYTCPKGLSFDPIGGICNWAAGLGCKE